MLFRFFSSIFESYTAMKLTWALAFPLLMAAVSFAGEPADQSPVKADQFVRPLGDVTPNGVVTLRSQHAADEILVKFKPGSSAAAIASGHAQLRGTVLKRSSREE